MKIALCLNAAGVNADLVERQLGCAELRRKREPCTVVCSSETTLVTEVMYAPSKEGVGLSEEIQKAGL